MYAVHCAKCTEMHNMDKCAAWSRVPEPVQKRAVNRNSKYMNGCDGDCISQASAPQKWIIQQLPSCNWSEPAKDAWLSSKWESVPTLDSVSWHENWYPMPLWCKPVNGSLAVLMFCWHPFGCACIRPLTCFIKEQAKCWSPLQSDAYVSCLRALGGMFARSEGRNGEGLVERSWNCILLGPIIRCVPIAHRRVDSQYGRMA